MAKTKPAKCLKDANRTRSRVAGRRRPTAVARVNIRHRKPSRYRRFRWCAKRNMVWRDRFLSGFCGHARIVVRPLCMRHRFRPYLPVIAFMLIFTRALTADAYARSAHIAFITRCRRLPLGARYTMLHTVMMDAHAALPRGEDMLAGGILVVSAMLWLLAV